MFWTRVRLLLIVERLYGWIRRHTQHVADRGSSRSWIPIGLELQGKGFSLEDQQHTIFKNKDKSVIGSLEFSKSPSKFSENSVRIQSNVFMTNDAGSQYRCGQAGTGIQPPSTPQVPHSHTQNASKTLVFALFDSCSRTDGRIDGRTDGRTKPLIELRVRN